VRYEGGSFVVSEEFMAMSYEPPLISLGVIGRRDRMEQSMVLLAYANDTAAVGKGLVITLYEQTDTFSAPPGNLFFTYVAEEFTRCDESAIMLRSEIEESAIARKMDFVPFCDAVCAQGCVGENCLCDEAARAAPPDALCAELPDCWEVCTQLTLNSPNLCDGVDYDPVTRQCYLTQTCSESLREQSATTEHWVKIHGAACLEEHDFERVVGRVVVSQRAETGQTYLLEPGMPQSIELHGSNLGYNKTVEERFMIISGFGECGVSDGDVYTGTVDEDGTKAGITVELQRGEYRVCFCDLDLDEDCDDRSSFRVQVGRAFASPLSCLASEPTFVQAVCSPQSGGGLRCSGDYTTILD
jgi:hypothetical protein